MGLFSSIGDLIGDVAGVVAAPATGGASLLPSLISAGGSLLGGDMTNSAAQASTAEGEQFAENMRSTAYQATTADMKAAGLNPMLAYSQGPTPTTGVPQTPITNSLGNAVNSGLSASSISNQNQLQQSQQSLNQSLALKAAADANLSNSSAKLNDANTSIKGPSSLISSAITKLLGSAPKISDTPGSFDPAAWASKQLGIGTNSAQSQSEVPLD